MAVKVAAPSPMRKAPDTFKGAVAQSVNRLTPKMFINAGAVLVALMMVAAGVRAALYQEPLPLCSDRIRTGTLFGLQTKSGDAIATTDLQARLGGRDWGVLENTKVVTLKDGPADAALQVALSKPPVGQAAASAQRSGMGFTWLVAGLAGAKSACLTYDLWLPDDFDFGRGGSLPGLFGGDTIEPPGKGQPAFATRAAWGENGTGALRATTAASPRGQNFPVDPDRLRIPRGRWVRLEQELILNEPGEENGIFRLWVDGQLHYNEGKILFRQDERSQFRGVIADLHYGDNGADFTAVPKATAVRVTPFVLRWQ